MTGKIATLAILLCAAFGGVAMYYLQVYGYYRTLPGQTSYRLGDADVAISGFQGIDSDSSPLRYRACFSVTGPLDLPEAPAAEPLNAPSWFDCFDAAAIGAALTAGQARGLMVQANVPWGFDRVMALFPDGRAYVWPQVNACGAAHFDGQRLPAGCPTPPER